MLSHAPRSRSNRRPSPACASDLYTDSRSERPRRRRRPRLPAPFGRRVVAASDRRGSATRIRADLVAAWEPHDRGAHRLALDERSGVLATLDVLTRLVPPALFTDANLSCPGHLPHGQSQPRAWQQRWLVLRLCMAWHHRRPRFGNYEAGFRFGRLGYELVEQRGLKRFQARTYMYFGNLVVPWTRHVRAGRDLVRRAFEVANKTGDLTFAAYSCDQPESRISSRQAIRSPRCNAKPRKASQFAQKARFGLVIDIITAQLGLVRTLRGLTPKFGSFDDADSTSSSSSAICPATGFVRCRVLVLDPKAAGPLLCRRLCGGRRCLIEGATAAVDIAIAFRRRRSITSTARFPTRPAGTPRRPTSDSSISRR